MKPKIHQAISTMNFAANLAAAEYVENLLARNIELEEIYDSLQPLLFELSVVLYKEDSATITLDQLVTDSIKLIKGKI